MGFEGTGRLFYYHIILVKKISTFIPCYMRLLRRHRAPFFLNSPAGPKNSRPAENTLQKTPAVLTKDTRPGPRLAVFAAPLSGARLHAARQSAALPDICRRPSLSDVPPLTACLPSRPESLP